MKLTLAPVVALAILASVVAAQNTTVGGSAACVTCLQTSLTSLPLCKGLDITMGNIDPGTNPAYAVCLCSSIHGAWIDACKDPSLCGPDIESFKTTFPSSLEQAGLRCNGTTPTYSPPPPDPVAPSSTFPSNASPTSGKSAGELSAVPSTLVIKALVIAAVVGAGFI